MVCLEDMRFILVRAKSPYVQFVAAARITSTEKFVVGVANERERDMSQVSDVRVLLRRVRACVLMSTTM